VGKFVDKKGYIDILCRLLGAKQEECKMGAGKIPAIAVLLLSFFILPDCVQAKYSGGSGTTDDPYQKK
jgi:hypothetical protein